VTGTVVPDLATVGKMFGPAGRPTGRPSLACLSFAARPSGAPQSETVALWAVVHHQRADGTLPMGARGDSSSQAMCALALERDVSVLQRGVVPQP
jgi:hypothetical protein